MRYVVVSAASGVAQRPHMHASRESAEVEAERLARQNRGDSFAIWEVRLLAAARFNDIAWTDLEDAPGEPPPPAPHLDDDHDIPF